MKLMKIRRAGNTKRLRRKAIVLICLIIIFIINLVLLYIQSENERREYEEHRNEISCSAPEVIYIPGVLGVFP